jgi:phenylpyruvate tautomerase PptA (4-oxalocrotonate tautomerase family)
MAEKHTVRIKANGLQEGGVTERQKQDFTAKVKQLATAVFGIDRVLVEIVVKELLLGEGEEPGPPGVE